MPDTTKCFDLKTRTITVGKEVASLGDLYKFCTPGICCAIGNPTRIVLVIDNSGSMCQGAAGGVAGTDPANMRITASNAFVDSVYNRRKDCEIGVIIYKEDETNDNGAQTVVGRLDPLNAGVAGNLALIHAAINSHPCGQTGHGATYSHKTTATYTGTALDTAVQNMIDNGYDSLVVKGMARHIIILTDGDWQTPVASDIYTLYVANHPGRPFPTIHGVFMGSGTQYDLSNLDTATYTSNNAAFNTCMSGGAFTTPSVTVQNDFTVEC